MRHTLRHRLSILIVCLLIAAAAASLAGCVQRIVDDGGGDGPGGCDAACEAELGWEGYALGRRSDINHFRGAIVLDSTFAEGYLGLGWFEIEYGYIDAAALSFQTAIDLDTSLVAAYAGRAYCLAALLNPDYDGAIVMAETAIQKGGFSWVFERNDQVSTRSLHLLLATIYFRLQNYSAALSEVDEVEPANGLDPSRRNFISELLLVIVDLGGTA